MASKIPSLFFVPDNRASIPPFFCFLYFSSSSSPAVLFLVLSLTRRKLLFRETEMGKRVCVRSTLACVRSPCVCRESRPVGAFFFFPTALFKLTHFYTYRSTVGNALLGQRKKNFGGGFFFFSSIVNKYHRVGRIKSQEKTKLFFLFELCRCNTFRPSEFPLSHAKN